MSYNNPNPNPENICSPTTATTSPDAFRELKLYQAFIFSVPICFTLIILFLFYFIYLHRRSVDWSSIGMRSSFITSNPLSMAELGLSKEVREMLPIVVYKESFSVTDSQCSVCLGDYQADDKLQQIPACGHTFHMDCIDQWLTTHTTCPLCRLSLVPKSSQSQPHHTEGPVSDTENSDRASAQPEPQPSESVNHSNVDQERVRDETECSRDTEALKEKDKDEQDSTGTSDACCNPGHC
ncbi:PREDICTED: RING-H2 finger protein ATL7-like [Tarenaya hassleriana]|uniref:RING-H2 finger protein ATL7-like n=1 Tax=Tarenaya hassleriana TaxID=28532 RepID=UPI00053C3BAF|nr:PREDICTED: RING-H2 finger protein ATL7-like [Tarenaya hassleriana]